MQDTDVFVKTDAGRAEIQSRDRGLSMAMRAILLMVDGQRDVAALRTVIAGSKAPLDALEELLKRGLIASRSNSTNAIPRGEPAHRVAAATSPIVRDTEPLPRLDLTLPTIYGPDEWAAPVQGGASAPAERSAQNRYDHLYTMINDVVRDFLPAHRRYLIQLKIERAGTPEELLALLDTVQAALVKAKGDEFAAGVIARLRAAAG